MPIAIANVLRAFSGAKVISRPMTTSLSELFRKEVQTNKQGEKTMIITINKVLADKVRIFNGRQQWPVGTVQFGNKQWVTLECDFQPQPGQSFDVAIKEKPNNRGGKFIDATIIGPAPAAAPPAQSQPFQTYQGSARNPIYSENHATATYQPAPQPTPMAQPGPSNAKISWHDWCETAGAAWAFGTACGMPAPEAVAFVNTTMIQFGQGKLAMPEISAVQDMGPLGTDGMLVPKTDDDVPW